MLEEQNIVKNKKKMLIAITITMALLLVVGISYAYWQKTKVQSDKNIISTGCFGVNLEGNEAINLSSAYPMKTEEGMGTTPYTFTITNTCSGSANYIVNLESLSNTTFQNSSIRVALDNTDKLYSEYDESSKYYNNSKEARKLISGRLGANESVTYNLRMWIDEKASSSEQNKIFASKIVVTSGQEGEVEGIEPEITEINATSTINTINISYKANGDISNTCKYGLVEGTYDNEVSNVTLTNCKITGLKDNTTYYYQICTETKKGNKCIDGNIKTAQKTLADIVELGDYISMTPTSTSYTLPNELSGCTGVSSTCIQNTINPSELNLWRVIRKNEDGTIDVVSEYVSSKGVSFYGKTGYINYIKALNEVAAQYTNEKYVARTRHIGYSNQTEVITDTSKLEQTTAPWRSHTSIFNQWGDCDSNLYLCGEDESLGAGDIGYETDYNLVNSIYKTMAAKNPSGKASAYWLSSRFFYYNKNMIWDIGYRSVSELNDLDYNLCLLYNESIFNYSWERSIRPILAIKSNIKIFSGDGKSAETSYRLE